MSRFARTSPGITPRSSGRRPGRPDRHNANLMGTGFNAVAEAVGRAILSNMGNSNHVQGASKPTAPEKCMYIMSTSTFRGWKRSMEDWLKLSKIPNGDAVLHIRLNCEEKLKRAIDAQFEPQQWSSLSVHAAFDAILSITTKSVNKAVLWDKFFNMKQRADESAKEYVHGCQQAAIDCDFQCPKCNGDLSDYIILHKLVNGLYNVKLKQDI